MTEVNEIPHIHAVKIEDEDRLRRYVTVTCSCGWSVHHQTPRRCAARSAIDGLGFVVECAYLSGHDGPHRTTVSGQTLGPLGDGHPLAIEVAWR